MKKAQTLKNSNPRHRVRTDPDKILTGRKGSNSEEMVVEQNH